MLWLYPMHSLPEDTIAMLMKKRNPVGNFLFFFLSLFFLCQIIWFLTAQQIEPYVAARLHVAPICHIISTLTPSVPVFAKGINIVSNGFSLAIDSACIGLEAILLLICAVFAFRSPVSKKILGIVSGSIFLYFFNILRIIILFYVMVVAPSFFDFVHVYAGQVLAVVFGTAFFFLWASWVDAKSPEGDET